MKKKGITTPSSNKNDGHKIQRKNNNSANNIKTINNNGTVNYIGNVNTLNHYGEDKRPKLSKRKAILLFGIIIPIVVIIIIILAILGYRQHNFISLSSEANSKMQSANFSEAAELFHKASSYALTNSDFVEAYCKEANQYLIMSYTENPDDFHEKQYLNNAIKIYNHIISNPSYKKTEYYYDAAAGLGFCYYNLNYSVEDSNWKNAVAIMEDYIDDFDYDNLSIDEAKQACVIFQSLYQYYERLANSSNKNFMNKEIAVKLAGYYAQFLSYYISTNNIEGQNDVDETLYLGTKLNDALMSYYITANGPEEKLLKQANLLEESIKKYQSSDNNVSPQTLFMMNYVLGKIYFFLCGGTNTAKVNEYRYKCHDILSNILQTPIEIGGEKLISAGFYCAVTGLCTDDEIIQIVSNNQQLLEKIEKENQIETFVKYALNTISTCAYISICYENHKDSDIYAKNLCEQLQKYRAYLNENQSTMLNNYYDYFTGSECDISNIQNMYYIMVERNNPSSVQL